MSDTDVHSDTDLLAAWRRGDGGAGSALVRRHFAGVTRFFERRLQGEALEEVLQTTFLACVESHKRVPDGVSFKAYLLGIARNKLLMHLRSKHGNKAPASLGAEPLAGSTLAPSRFAAEREEQRLLLQALLRLPGDLQMALELHYWEDLTTGEIAAVLEIPKGTVKTRLARARSTLQRHIEEISTTPRVAHDTLGDLDRWAHSLRRQVIDSDA